MFAKSNKDLLKTFNKNKYIFLTVQEYDFKNYLH